MHPACIVWYRLSSQEQIRYRKQRCRQSGHFTRLVGDSSFSDYLDLFKFRSFEAKKSRHVDDLIRTYEVRGLSAEFLYAGRKLAALHCFRDLQAKAACAFLGAKQAEVANNHFTSLLLLVCSLTTLQSSATTPCYQAEIVGLKAECLRCNPLVTNEHESFAVCDPQIKHPFSVVL